MMSNILTDAAKLVDHNARNLHAVVATMLAISVVLITTMWLVNIFLLPAINLIPTVVGIIALLTTLLHPKFIFWAAGLGAVVQGLKDEDITQGAVKGISELFKILKGGLFYLVMACAVLTLIPFQSSPMTFWALALAGLLVTALGVYPGLTKSKWLIRLTTALAVLIAVVYIGLMFKDSGLGKWISRTWEANVERCLGDQICPEPPEPTTVDSRPEMVTARQSGQVIAPVGIYSAWLKYPFGKCVNWWTDAPEDHNDISSRYIDENKEIWGGGSQGKKVVARSWKGNLNRPVRVYYQLADRESDGSCSSF